MSSPLWRSPGASEPVRTQGSQPLSMSLLGPRWSSALCTRGWLRDPVSPCTLDPAPPHSLGVAGHPPVPSALPGSPSARTQPPPPQHAPGPVTLLLMASLVFLQTMPVIIKTLAYKEMKGNKTLKTEAKRGHFLSVICDYFSHPSPPSHFFCQHPLSFWFSFPG